jgi:hypothetical protein
MDSILVRGLDQKTIERLKERARLNGRSLQQEVKALLSGRRTPSPCARRDGWRSGGSTGSVNSRCPTAPN